MSFGGGCSIVAIKVATLEGTLDDSYKILLGLEESTPCHLKKVSIEVYILTHNRSHVNTCAITAAKRMKNAYSNASFSNITAATKSLGSISDNGFKTAQKAF